MFVVYSTMSVVTVAMIRSPTMISTLSSFSMMPASSPPQLK